MACHSKIKSPKNKDFRRKLHILRHLINSNSDKTSSIIMDAFFCISALTLKLEELERGRMDNAKHIDDHQLPLLEVKVEKQGNNNGFRLNIKSEKGKDNLVHILETFEEMGVNVTNARVSCITHFDMEATLEVSQVMDPNVLTEAVHKAIERSTINSIS